MAVESQGFQPGAGDPYWYEWYVGLGYVVSLLSGADDVAAVTFQKAGLEGVDDVVVQRSNSRPSVCIQVKHEKASTNIKSNLTFGMLVDGSEKKGALIRSLALGWKQMFREAGVSPEVILYTNRSFGSNRTTRTFQQKTYSCLPIVDFMKEARAVLLGANSLGEISFCSDGLQLQWEEFVHAIGMDPEDTLEFLKSLNIKAEAPSLREIENNLLERIASEVCLGSQALAEKIFMCLKAELSKWTTAAYGENTVTRPVVLRCVGRLNNKPLSNPIDVRVPVPVFPSRKVYAESIAEQLAQLDKKVVFLDGGPGAGKTRLVSVLCSEMGKAAFRFYAFKPLDADDYSYSPDAGVVGPSDLWSTLLNQLRECSELSTYDPEIPILNDLCTADQLRSEVMRLAAVLSRLRGDRVFIFIDGIDHAARAKNRVTFLSHLPSPSTIPDGVTMVLSGQPVQLYSDYPQWLKGNNPLVERITVPALTREDIGCLLESRSSLHGCELATLAGEILLITKGNTLSVIYAIHMIEGEQSVEQSLSALRRSGLSDNIGEYYEDIWEKANVELQRTNATGVNILDILTSSMHLLDGCVYPKLLRDSFPDVFSCDYVIDDSLNVLSPLLRKCGDGSYRPIHNDFRLFVSAKALESNATCRLQFVAKRLAETVLSLERSSIRACYGIRLLVAAGRARDCIELFDTRFVIDAVAQGIPWEALCEQASSVYSIACESRNLRDVNRIAQTLSTLSQINEHFDYLLEPRPFLRLDHLVAADYLVVPLTSSTASAYTAVLERCAWLVSEGFEDEARELYENWFSGITPASAIFSVTRQSSPRYFSGGDAVTAMLVQWGRLAACWPLDYPELSRCYGAGDEIVDNELKCFRDAYVRYSIKSAKSCKDVDAAINRCGLSPDCVPDILRDLTDGVSEVVMDARLEFCRLVWSRFPEKGMGKTAKCVLSAEGCTEALSEDAYNGLLGIRNGYLFDDEFSCSLVAECFLFGYDSSENSCAAACNSMEAKLGWLDKSEREYLSLLLCARVAVCLGYSVGHRRGFDAGSPEAVVVSDLLESKHATGFGYQAYRMLLYILLHSSSNELWNRAIDVSSLSSYASSSRPLGLRALVFNYFLHIGDLERLGPLVRHQYGLKGHSIIGTEDARGAHELLGACLKACDPDLFVFCDEAIAYSVAGFTEHKDYSLKQGADLFEACTEKGVANEDMAARLMKIDAMASYSGGNRMSPELHRLVLEWAASVGPACLSRVRQMCPDFLYDYAELRDEILGALQGSESLEDVVSCFAGLYGITSYYSEDEIYGMIGDAELCRKKAADLGTAEDFSEFVSEIYVMLQNRFSGQYKQQREMPLIKKSPLDSSVNLNGADAETAAFREPVYRWDWNPVLMACKVLISEGMSKSEVYSSLATERALEFASVSWLTYSSSVRELVDNIAENSDDDAFFRMLSERREALVQYGANSASVDISHLVLQRAKAVNPGLLPVLLEDECECKEAWLTLNGILDMPKLEMGRQMGRVDDDYGVPEFIVDLLVGSLTPEDTHRCEDVIRGLAWGGRVSCRIRRRLHEILRFCESYIRQLLLKLCVYWVDYGFDSDEGHATLGESLLITDRADEACLLAVASGQTSLSGLHAADVPRNDSKGVSDIPPRVRYLFHLTSAYDADAAEDIQEMISCYPSAAHKTWPTSAYARRGDTWCPRDDADNYSQVILYNALVSGRWPRTPLPYISSVLVDPADVWTMAELPILETASFEIDDIGERLEMGASAGEIMEAAGAMAASGLNDGEKCLGWKLYVPFSGGREFEGLGTLRIRKPGDATAGNVLDREFGCYSLQARVGGGLCVPSDEHSCSLCNLLMGVGTIILGDCQMCPSYVMRFLGFSPSRYDPMLWESSGGERIAWFERRLYPCRLDNREAYYRQPQMFRWVCDWSRVVAAASAKGFEVYKAKGGSCRTDQMKARQDLARANRMVSPFKRTFGGVEE